MVDITLEVSTGSPPPLDGFQESSPWLDGDGAVCARVFVESKNRWVDWPSLGLFAVGLDRSTVRVWPSTGVALDLVHDFFKRRLQPLILQARGYQALHASASQVGSVAVAFTGASGCGKSTLAYAMALEGSAQIADDAVVIDTRADPPEVLLLPFKAQLRGASLALAQVSGTNAEHAGALTLPLALIVLLEQTQTASVPRVARLSGPASCVELISHAHVFDPLADNERLVTGFARLADTVPAVHVRYRPGLEHLPQLTATVRKTLEDLGAAEDGPGLRE